MYLMQEWTVCGIQAIAYDIDCFLAYIVKFFKMASYQAMPVPHRLQVYLILPVFFY